MIWGRSLGVGVQALAILERSYPPYPLTYGCEPPRLCDKDIHMTSPPSLNGILQYELGHLSGLATPGGSTHN